MDTHGYIAAVLLSLLVTFLLYLWKKNQNVPPGPWGLPFFGYYPFLSNQPCRDLCDLAKRYGDVVSFRTVGGKLVVAVNGSKAIREMFVNRSEDFIGRPTESHVLDWFTDGLGIAQEEGDTWKDHKRFFLRAVKQFGFGKLDIEPRIHEEIQFLLDELGKAGQEPVHLLESITHTVNCIICPILFSCRYEKDHPTYRVMWQGLRDMPEAFVNSRHLIVGWFFRYVVMNFSPGAKAAWEAKINLEKVMDDVVEDHIRRFDPENLRDYVDCYLQERKEQEIGNLEESTFSLARLKAITLNMLMEATDSVAVTLSSLLTELSHHREEQERVQQELDTVVSHERLPSWLDKPKLPRTEALVLELFRKAMHFTISTLYSNPNETHFRGYRIPKRSIVIANLWSVNNDPEIYPEPWKFDPGRFLNAEGTRIKTDGPYPYGIGKRSCTGESLAQMEVFLVISAIIQNFTLSPVNNEKKTVKLEARPKH